MIFHPNIVELRQFYSSELGRLLRRDIGREIGQYLAQIPDCSTIAGLGFTVPYLGDYLGRNLNIISCMFAHLGAMYWPANAPNHTVLSHEGSLPFADNQLDYILLAHAAEHSIHLNNLLAEVFRCLKPSGKVLIIAPNRRGWWQVNVNNPFGVGNAFHAMQLRHRAELAGLTYVAHSSALFYPPSNNRLWQKSSLLIEYLGLMLAPNWGGVLLVEFEKQLYAAILEPKKKQIISGILHPQVN